MSMRDKFSPRPDDFDMGRRVRSWLRPGRGFVSYQKRATRRASRQGGSFRAISEGLQSIDGSTWEELV